MMFKHEETDFFCLYIVLKRGWDCPLTHDGCNVLLTCSDVVESSAVLCERIIFPGVVLVLKSDSPESPSSAGRSLLDSGQSEPRL